MATKRKVLKPKTLKILYYEGFGKDLLIHKVNKKPMFIGFLSEEIEDV